MKIYNSLTRKKEEFRPINEGKVGVYVCGPTVYDEAHIGHARSAYVFDVIRRYLEYKGYGVTFVRNVTDVDDKIIDRARSEFKSEDLNTAVEKVSGKYLDSYHADMAALGIMPPTKEPRATGYIDKMKFFIAGLIERGVAYESGGDVFFCIKKAKDYGKLSNQNLGKMEIGARVAPGERKKDGLDFALWKKAKEGEPSWDSPWGPGRPGWHIECSVMSSDILGDEFDIHGGGLDLIFPHHENEIAQSEGAGKAFAKYWIHNGLLTINNEKMAKSLGNYITVKDFIARHKDPDLLKLLFLGTHYRHPVDYSEGKMEEAAKQKRVFNEFFDKINTWRLVKEGKVDAAQAADDKKKIGDIRSRFDSAMDDDFNGPQALACLFELADLASSFVSADKVEAFMSAGRLMERAFGIFGLKPKPKRALPDDFLGKIREREAARKGRDFKKADEIRREVEAKYGGTLADTSGGITFTGK